MKGLFKGEHKPILGEFAAVSPIPSKDTAYAMWKYDPPQADSTLARLKLLEKEGCDLALSWPDVPVKFDPEKYEPMYYKIVKMFVGLVTGRDILKLTPKTRAEIISYTGGKLPLLETESDTKCDKCD